MSLLDVNNNNNLKANYDADDDISKTKRKKRKQTSSESNSNETVPIKLPKATDDFEIIDESDLNKIVFNFILNDSAIHMNVLNYEPLDFKAFSEQFANSSLVLKKIEDKTLMRILDEYGVTFTLKSFNSRRRGRRSSKKKRWKKRRK